jgi:CheY-like chemotaxis protein
MMKKRILIIDDDIMLNKINEKVLSSAGLVNELHIATNGKQGMDYLLNRITKGYPVPEVIILDLHMPVMGGFEFMEEFNKLDFAGKSNIELVVFTATSSPRDKQRLTSMGIKHVISKPYILRGLVDIIGRMRTEVQMQV